jgi:hypothetical protein
MPTAHCTGEVGAAGRTAWPSRPQMGPSLRAPISCTAATRRCASTRRIFSRALTWTTCATCTRRGARGHRQASGMEWPSSRPSRSRRSGRRPACSARSAIASESVNGLSATSSSVTNGGIFQRLMQWPRGVQHRSEAQRISLRSEGCRPFHPKRAVKPKKSCPKKRAPK